MLPAIAITLREGFEAALVIGIMLAFVTRTGRRSLRRPIVIGAVVAVVASIAAGTGLGIAGVQLENPAIEGVLYLAAGGLVLTMVYWMLHAGGDVRRNVESGIARASSSSTLAVFSVGLVSFFMVAREGAETVLFLGANALDQGALVTATGALVGLATAAGLGVAVYYGAARIDLKLFFYATSIALVLLATRFIGLGLLELSEASVLALPEAIEEGLALLDEGAVATGISVAVVAIPIAAVGWSLLHHHRARTAA
jgi:high-affinity iron transporter